MRMQSLTLVASLAACSLLMGSDVPPPEHVQWMKDMGQAQGKIRKGEDVEASAKKMAEVSKQVGAFWAKRAEDGAKFAKDGETAALAMATAAAANDAAGVQAAGRTLGGTCRGCHDAHREKISETEYKIK